MSIRLKFIQTQTLPKLMYETFTSFSNLFTYQQIQKLQKHESREGLEKTQHKNPFLLCKLGWKILVAKDNLLDTSISISGLTRKKTTNHTILLIQEKTSKIVCRNPHFFHFLKLPTKKPQIEATEYRTKQKFQFSVWSPQSGIVFFFLQPFPKSLKKKGCFVGQIHVSDLPKPAAFTDS